MDETFVCLGSCHALISKKQYDEGLVTCGDESCSLKGQPFVEGKKCKKCGITYEAEETHACTL